MRIVEAVKVLISFIYFSFILKRNKRRVYITCGSLGDACYGLAFSNYILENDKNSIIYVSSKNEGVIKKSFPQINPNNFLYYKVNSFAGKCFSTIIFSRRLCSYFKKKDIFVLYITSGYKATDDVPKNILSIISENVFRIQKLPYITYPKVPEVDVKSINNFENDKNRIVVCNPYSNSMLLESSYDLWKVIVEKLKQKGYIVYSNAFGDQEGIEGTIPLRCDIFEFAKIAQEIPIVISIRSGLMDYIINTPSAKFIIYGYCDAHAVSENTMYNIYNMSAWGKDNVTQCNPSMTKEEILGKLDEFISTYSKFN